MSAHLLGPPYRVVVASILLSRYRMSEYRSEYSHEEDEEDEEEYHRQLRRDAQRQRRMHLDESKIEQQKSAVMIRGHAI